MLKRLLEKLKSSFIKEPAFKINELVSTKNCILNPNGDVIIEKGVICKVLYSDMLMGNTYDIENINDPCQWALMVPAEELMKVNFINN